MAKKCKPNWKDLPKEVADLKEQIEQCCEQPSEQTTINGKSGDVVIEAGEGISIDNSGDGIVISSTGDEGIQSIVEGDNISVDNTDPSNPIVSVSGIVMPEQHFVEITEGSNTGYGTKYRKDNPNNYGDIGNRAIDLGFSTSASSTRGARGQYSTVSGGQNNTASGSQSTVSGGQNITANGIASTVSGGNSNTANGISSTVSGGNSNTASGNASTVSGGQNNTASGTQSTVSGGESNTANSYMSWFGGRFSTLFTGQSTNSWVATDILFNIGNGTGGSSRSNALSLFKNGRLELPSYGDGTFTGTATKLLAVDADGKVIEEDLPTPGDSLTITDNDQVEAENVNTINFIGATVTDNEDGSVDVEYISGGSSVTIGTDGQIPFVNSDEDDFEYSGNLTYNGASLMNGSNVYMNHNGFQVLATGYNTDIGQYSIHQALNNPGTNPTISIENTGTGDAGIGFKAGSRGVTMGIDNSDGDLFKISVGSSIPNVGAGTVILEADNNQIKLPIYGSGTITGTATKLLAVDADGKVIEEDLPTSGQIVKQAKVTVTPQQMLDLASNPVELIPAQGANTQINILSIMGYLDYGTTPFNFSGDIIIKQNVYEGFIIVPTVINATNPTYFRPSASTNGIVPTWGSDNNPITLEASDDATQGDSPVTFVIDYTVHNYN